MNISLMCPVDYLFPKKKREDCYLWDLQVSATYLYMLK